MTTSSTFNALANSTTAVEKARHLKFGSGPVSKTAPRPPAASSLGSVAESMFSGHWISRVTPSTSLTWGRVVWKSKNSSPSKPPKRRASHELARAPTATLAASAASFQPVKPAMRTGRSSSGVQSMSMCRISMGLAYHAASDEPKEHPSRQRSTPGSGRAAGAAGTPVRGSRAPPAWRGGGSGSGSPEVRNPAPAAGSPGRPGRLWRRPSCG